ncbi:hypothetical protein CH63R_14050 [Colletotrichum higginsianum IMI 349063]|uniref:Uncharacterized protein n=1 Tax=Colletotrichum higginsianum (strain IMI 349063) TaxID=759273 RepID=A0A1B7XSW9_COLHI|nr:hypothetical protein CH63R_14050 [Colletotrichum higginsianum IMI 349063]OBR02824.1 hypothetical protein CH63R_14050 [Colletotrichum higginsianum IMI 349063]
MRVVHADPLEDVTGCPAFFPKVSRQGALNLVLVSDCWFEASRPSGFEIHGAHLAGMPEAVLRCRTGALVRDRDLDAVQLPRPPLRREPDDAEEEVALDGEAFLAARVVLPDADTAGADPLARGQREVVDQLGACGDAGAEVDGAAEDLEDELDAQVDIWVDADGGPLRDVGVRGPDGVPARRGRRGGVDEVQVKLGVGEGEAEVRGDARHGVRLKLDADGEAQRGAELDDAGDVHEACRTSVRAGRGWNRAESTWAG